MRSQAFRTVTRIIMYSAPLMVILFLFFPRLPPLWSMPEPSRQAKTGITDELSFGDIAELSQSSELAFRVVFDDFKEMPSKSQLYWRATVLENFDGQKWTQNFYTKFSPSIVTTSKNQAQLPRWYSPQVDLSLASYQMIMEPNFQSWTYALEHSIASEPLLMKGDLAIYSPYEVIQRRVFDINLLKPKPLAQTIIYDEKIRVLNLEWGSEENQNPRTYQLTQKLKQQHQHPEAYAQAVMNWIANNDFSYTLSPPLLSGHRVDDFLFRSKAGFCEHYASAYVTMMRMAGIPARIVIGYQGGQWAPDQKSWEVRQLDAHAWTEIWIENKGWVRIDPTSAIAPDRIEQGMQSFSAQNTSLFGESNNLAWQVQRYQWLTKARIWIDYANYQWQNKIVGFDRDKQNHWLKKLSIENITEQIIYLILGLASILGLIIWRLTAKQRVVRSSLEIALEKFSKRIAKKQLSRLPNEPVLTWLERIELIFPSTQLQRIKQLYRDHVYIQELEQNQLKELLDLLKKYPIEK